MSSNVNDLYKTKPFYKKPGWHRFINNSKSFLRLFFLWVIIPSSVLFIILFGVDSCKRHYAESDKFQERVELCGDSLNYLFPHRKILTYDIIKPVQAYPDKYEIWLKNEQGVQNVYVDKNKITLHVDSTVESNYCKVTLIKLKGRLVAYHESEEIKETDGNGHYTGNHYWHRKTNNAGIRDDKPIETRTNYFDGEHYWYNVYIPNLKQKYYDSTEGFPKQRYIKYMCKQIDVYVKTL